MLVAPFYQLPDRLPKMVYPYILANVLKAPQNNEGSDVFKTMYRIVIQYVIS